MKKKQTLLGLLILVVVVIAVVLFVLDQQGLLLQAQAPGAATTSSQTDNQSTRAVTPNPKTTLIPGAMTHSFVISHDVPAFSSPGYYPASYANDTSYDTQWRSQGTPAWLAYDLSSVPASQRSKVLVVWYNQTLAYDHTLVKEYAYNLPQDYTLDVNSASGGIPPPDAGWKTLVTVKGNHYHSRQHVFDMAGNNWLRINVTATDGSLENFDAALNMDVYNANFGVADDWIFFGDSITAGAMGQGTVGNGVKAFAQLINAQAPAHFPIQESGGIGYLTSADGARYISTWLELFQGKYVGLSYGTNDAIDCVSGDTFYNNYVTMVQAVLNAGKTPVVPQMPWGAQPNIQRCGPALNARIDALYTAYPQIIKGPDLWTFFRNNQQLISKDTIHPSDVGFGVYRQQWANTILKEVYAAAK